MRKIGIAIVTASTVVAAAACSETRDVGTSVDAESAYWALELNHRGVNLSTTAPWNTVQLAVTPRTYQGVAVPADSGVVTYVSADTNSVSVTANGMLLAKRVATRVRVVARMAIGPITHADTAFVSVFALTTPPVLTQFSIDPVAPDSAKTADPISLTGTTIARNAMGQPINNLVVAYRGSNPRIADVTFQGGLTPSLTGKITVTASTYAFGVVKADTVEYTIGQPLVAYAYIGPFTDRTGQPVVGIEGGASFTIGVGGIVFFSSMFDPDAVSPRVISIRFDNPANVEVGTEFDGSSMPDDTIEEGLIPGYQTIVRRFTAPGTYTFRDANSTLVGTVRVIDERPSP